MLEIVIPKQEFYDQVTEEFINTKAQRIQLEHSLVSLSKWESKWCKPFLSSEKNKEEAIDYIRCMTITQNIKPDVYNYIPPITLSEINKYIEAPMTATWFREIPGAKKNKEVITSELIYYWMIAQNIPMECQKWHLNRLITLIKVCAIKSNPPKKMGKKEMLANQRALNESRRSKLNSKG